MLAASRRSSGNDPRLTHKGRATAWLIKARSDGSNAKWFQSTGRRFFILDFDKRIFYYTYTESRQAQASTPIPFVDILGAHVGHSYEPDADCGQLCRSRPRRCLPGSYPFTVRTKGKRLRLEAEEESDAFRWISMLNAAHRIGAEVDLLHCNSWLPPSTVPEQIKDMASEKTTVDSGASTGSSPPESLTPESSIEPPAPTEAALRIVEADQGNLSEPFQPEKPSTGRPLHPADFGFEDDEVDISDDATTTVLPTDGSCSHLGDRFHADEASEDSGCEDFPASSQMQQEAVASTGGYASAPDECSARAATDLLLLKRPFAFNGLYKTAEQKKGAQRISEDLRLLHREVARSSRLPTTRYAVLE
mmetsp:Transcript_108806/g.132814  ORF Transcript_108806/g.132814 Transcript_108806/m.132814 type:complete len:362 (-) Transcript_108806:105-1190(-)